MLPKNWLTQVRMKRRSRHTWRAIVADHVPCVHTIYHLALGAILDSTSDLGCSLPDNLGVMAPSIEAAHVRALLAIIRRLVVVEFAVVPHVSSGHLDSTSFTQILSTTGYSPHSNVLAITCVTDIPI